MPLATHRSTWIKRIVVMTRNLVVSKAHIVPWVNVDLWFQFGARSPNIRFKIKSDLENVRLSTDILSRYWLNLTVARNSTKQVSTIYR